MDNTRHERAIIVVASYVIGFTTAFIAFGAYSNSSNSSVDSSNLISSEQTDLKVPEATILIKEDGMFVATEDRERLVTIRSKSPLMANVIDSYRNTPGVADRLVDAELSRDSQFAYFCEQRDINIDVCFPYIYSVAEDVLYPVKVTGLDYAPAASSHVSVWLADGTLSVNGHKSVSPDTPWLLNE